MSNKNNPPYNTVCFYDLATNSLPSTKAFYSQVFGWQYRDVGGYDFINDGSPDGGALVMGGLRQSGSFDSGGGVLTYINVADLDLAATKIQAAGGKLVSPRIPVPGYGAFIVFNAPGGVQQAIWQSEGKPT